MLYRFIREMEDKLLSGGLITREEALLLASAEGPDMMDLIAAANRLRVHFKGNRVKLCGITNAKSGRCPEDCAFCAQSVRFDTGVEVYPLRSPDEIMDAARAAEKSGATEFSIVLATRGVRKEREVAILADSIGRVVKETGLKSCVSPGIMTEEGLSRLMDAGLECYHHNLETSRRFFPSICTTHSYEDDVNSVRRAKGLGLFVCCGGIFGMGESMEDRIDLAFTLRELDVDSVPINFLNPIKGTPLEGADHLTPMLALKIIALYRFILPQKELLVAGGREVNLRDLQSWMFAAGANGTLLGNYLTTRGRAPHEDLAMIADLGLVPDTDGCHFSPADCPGPP